MKCAMSKKDKAHSQMFTSCDNGLYNIIKYTVAGKNSDGNETLQHFWESILKHKLSPVSF